MALTPRALARRTTRRRGIGLAVLIAGFLTSMFGTMAAAITEAVHPALVVMFGFGLLIVGGVIFAFAEPDPPTSVSPPAVPATVRVMCPNCGATPTTVDRDGVAVCDYCGTRFVVP